MRDATTTFKESGLFEAHGLGSLGDVYQ